jgi:hypothetical protein
MNDCRPCVLSELLVDPAGGKPHVILAATHDAELSICYRSAIPRGTSATWPAAMA